MVISSEAGSRDDTAGKKTAADARLCTRRQWLSHLLVGVVLILVALALLAWQSRGAVPPTRAPAGAESPTSRPALESPHVTRDADGHLQWDKPRTTDRQRERNQLVDRHIARGDRFSKAVTDARVIAAMRAVPRHEFVPRSSRGRAYIDSPLPIGHGQTISQPYIVALMTELLDVREGDRILEIGTGSGYQAAVLSELTPHVYSVEILQLLHEDVVARFERLGYKTIQTRHADGYDGWPEAAPFDGIIVTCAAGHVPPPLWEQLKPGGKMVIPVGGVYQTQRLLVLEKDHAGKRSSKSVLAVRFVPMTGKAQEK